MNDFRAALAVFVYCISLYLIYDLWANGFSIYIVLACLLGFVTAHYLWPKERSGESAWYEALELIIDLPFRTIAFSIRGLGRLSGKDGVDLDV